MNLLRKFSLGSVCLVLVLGVACAASKDSTTPPDPMMLTTAKPKDLTQVATAIDALAADSLTANGPGVAVLILKDNQILHAKGYGFSNIKTKTPITPDTRFDLASVSKQMTVIAILKLMEQGKLDIDHPISDYLPEFRNLKLDRPVSIRHLLNHTSGLDDYTGSSWTGSDAKFANLSLEAHLTWLNDQTPLNEPGVVFEYNNSGYALLALIVQRISRQPFAQFMQTEIFQPLGMTHTLVYRRLGQTIPNQATGYMVSEDGQVELSSFSSIIAGDGNVFSSLNDLVRYDQALRQAQIVSAPTLALAFAPGKLADGSPIEKNGESYGMGWEIAGRYVHHDGSWMGTSTYYRHYLQPAVSIIVLSNDENYDSTDLSEKIAQLLDL